MGLYLREIGEFPLLSPDAERDLAKQVWDEEGRMNAEIFRSPVAPRYLEEASCAQLRGKIAQLPTALPSRDTEILRLRFGIGCTEHTLEEVGERFAVTRERIRQLENRALRKLRLRKVVGASVQTAPQVHVRAAAQIGVPCPAGEQKS